MDTERGDELVQLLRHLHHGVLTASDALTLGIACGTRRKPTIGVKNYLQVLTQIMTRHCQQHGVKIDAAPEVGLVPFAPIGADVVDLMHVPPLTSTARCQFYGTSIDETNKANQMRMNFAKRPSARRREDPYRVIPASSPVLSGGSHQRLHEVTSLDGRNDDSHTGGNQVNPDQQAKCPSGTDWPVHDKQPGEDQIRDAAREHPAP